MAPIVHRYRESIIADQKLASTIGLCGLDQNQLRGPIQRILNQLVYNPPGILAHHGALRTEVSLQGGERKSAMLLHMLCIDSLDLGWGWRGCG